MKHPHTPTPWTIEISSSEDELLIFSAENCVASVPIWHDGDDDDTLRDLSHANAAFIVRACNAHDNLVTTLKLALEALNTARRFRVGDTDSYRIASRIDAALKAVEVAS